MHEWLSMQPTKMVGCMVSDEKLALHISNFFNRYHIEWEWLRSQPCYEGEFVLRNRYDNVGQLGSDRWHAAIGAVRLFPERTLVVAQMGTATTVDIVRKTETGYDFLGGRILAGSSMMFRMLTESTRCRPVGIGTWKEHPSNTTDAMTTGVIEAHLGVIAGAYRQAERCCGDEPLLVLSGGAAPLLSPFVKEVYPKAVQKHNLVLHGLAARTNQQGVAS